ncbi:hypothetical protein GF376_03235 [Candidatus Peregrinibacteria bacterium]|nr:hypothetical protein [Candidatus Peregrinibacteria bacterium]
MIRIIIKTIPQNRLFDPMPLPKKKRKFNSFSKPKINMVTTQFNRKISKIN